MKELACLHVARIALPPRPKPQARQGAPATACVGVAACDALRLRHEGGATATIYGPVAGQAEVHGVRASVRDTALPMSSLASTGSIKNGRPMTPAVSTHAAGQPQSRRAYC
jgi:hypothetical protein